MRPTVLAVAVALAATATSSLADDPPMQLTFERYRLDNGLEVILHQDNKVPLVAINVWYHVGSRDEGPGQSGFAHLYEHMFKNSEHLGDRHHYAILREAGVQSANATTSPDRTSYYEVLPSNQLELGLWIESDRMGYFLGGLSQERLDAQIDVVKNERRQRYENTRYGRERLAVAQALYPEGHPHRHLTIGRHEDIEAATMDAVVRFYRQWYVPANATLVIAGDFESADVRALVDKWFGSFPVSTRPARRAARAPTPAPARIEVEDPFAQLVRIRWAWISPAAYQPGDADLDLLSHALTSTTGRLYKRLVHELQLAQRVGSRQASFGLNGEFHIVVDVRSGGDPAEVERILAEELAAVRTGAVTPAEIDRARTRQEAAFIWGLERLNSRANLLQRYNQFQDDPGFLEGDLERYRAVTPDTVRAAAERWLGDEHRVQVITVPRAGD